MPIFVDDDDAIKFIIRKIYHDVLFREIDSQATQDSWLATWKQDGGDTVLFKIMDSAEGVDKMAKVRAHFGM